MIKAEKKPAKMSVHKLTAEKIARKAGVSKDTALSTLSGRRTNAKVIEVVQQANALVEKFLNN